jgi:hypothetical protein
VDVFGFGIFLIPPANSVSRNASLLHFFLLILQGIRNTIGCKSETKRTRKVAIMECIREKMEKIRINNKRDKDVRNVIIRGKVLRGAFQVR